MQNVWCQYGTNNMPVWTTVPKGHKVCAICVCLFWGDVQDDDDDEHASWAPTNHLYRTVPASFETAKRADEQVTDEESSASSQQEQQDPGTDTSIQSWSWKPVRRLLYLTCKLYGYILTRIWQWNTYHYTRVTILFCDAVRSFISLCSLCFH